MTNCKHKVVFSEEYKSIYNGSELTHVWGISDGCPVCGHGLDDEEAKIALSQMYVREVAELVFTAFENKRDYLKAVSELSANGITTTLSPKVAN
ncbi:MAG: hypothetical protein AAB552_03310 [Patescibacteria group bacterium]